MPLAVNFLSAISLFLLGGALETQYQLLSYGIPVSALPIDPFHIDHHTAWMQRRKNIEKARERNNEQLKQPQPNQLPSSSTAETVMTDDSTDKSLPTPTMVTSNTLAQDTVNNNSSASASPNTNTSTKSPLPLQPGPNDCILGRGRAIDQHVGNVQFRKYLQQHLKEYQETPQYLKAHLAEPIRQRLMKDHGVRFFKQVQKGSGGGSGSGIGRTSSPSNQTPLSNGTTASAKSNGGSTGSATTTATVWEYANETAVKEKILRTFRRIQLNEQKKQQKQ